MAASESDFTNLSDDGVGVFLGGTTTGEWIKLAAAIKSLTPFFVAKNPDSTGTGTEPTDVLAYLGFGADGQAVNHLDWRVGADSGVGFEIDENTGTQGTPVWSNRVAVAAGGAVSLATSLTLAAGSTVVAILDEDAMGSDDDTALATQQSIKAYVDSAGGVLDIDGLTGESAIANADTIPFYDDTAAANRKITYAELVTALEGAGSLSHDALDDYLAAEHVDWAGASAGTVHSTNLDTDVVQYDAAGEFTAAQGATEVTTGSSSGTYTMDFSATNYFELTLTENVTTVTINNKTSPGTYVLKIIQGAGAYTVDFGAGVLWPAGAAPVISTASSAVDILSFVVDSGGTVYGVFSQDFS